MIKVMIVDDEPFIRQGLQILIKWEQYGFEIAGEASNGAEAFDLIKKQDFDLVITDIKMPVMDGIELIEHVRQDSSINIHFMILSGFYEYEYAKKAIKYDIEDYILKPVQKDELIKLLEDYKVKFYKSLEEQRKLELSDKLAFDRYVSHLLRGIQIKDELSYIESCLCDTSDARYIGFEYDQSGTNYRNLSEEDKLRLQTLLYDALKDYTNEYGNHVYLETDRSTSDYLIGFIYVKKISDTAGCSEREYIQKLRQEMCSKLPEKVVLFIGQMVSDISALADSYKSAVIARNFQRFSNESDIAFYDEIQHTDKVNKQLIYTDIMDGLVRAIEENDEDGIKKQTDAVYMHFREWVNDQNIIKINLDYLLVNLIKVIKNLDPDFDREAVYQMIGLGGKNIGTIHGSVKHIRTFSFEFAQYINQLRQNTFSGVLKNIEWEVTENYSTNLSLKTLSKKYFLNSAYLGQIFKKKFGCSFKDYLNNYRIERAAELLLRSDKKIYLVAEEVGFNNTDYFVSKFVQVKGITPLQYRKQSVADN